MSLLVKGKVMGMEREEFTYTDKKTNKEAKGVRCSLFIIDGGRPIEVRVHEKSSFKEGQSVELPVFVSAFVTRAGGAGFRLVHLNKQ